MESTRKWIDSNFCSQRCTSPTCANNTGKQKLRNQEIPALGETEYIYELMKEVYSDLERRLQDGNRDMFLPYSARRSHTLWKNGKYGLAESTEQPSWRVSMQH